MSQTGNKILISKYIRFHKPAVMKELGIDEMGYERIYHVQQITRTLRYCGYVRNEINQAVYALIDAVKSEDPKVRNGCILISKLGEKRCIITNCNHDIAFSACEAESEANHLVAEALTTRFKRELHDYTNHLKLVFLCHQHCDLNIKGMGFAEILMMIDRAKRVGYDFTELF